MNFTVEVLSACIKRAERDFARGSSSWVDSRNEYYWHVREKCVELASRNGLRIAAVIQGVNKRGSTLFEVDRKLDEITDPIWDLVIHPELLCKEVLES